MDKRKTFIAAVVVYAVLALVHFLPLHIWWWMVLPMAALSVFAAILLPWPLKIAAVFSTLGDLMGALDNLIPQMGFFAVAQVAFIVYFLGLASEAKKSGKGRGRYDGTFAAAAFVVAGVAIYYLVMVIAPAVPAGVLRTGIIIYGDLVTTMAFCGILQKKALFALGGVLFLFSDCMIAINSFVNPISYAGHIIMSTYYAAQILLFIGAYRQSANKNLIK